MNEQELTQMELLIKSQAGRFPYPATPDIAAAVQRGLSPAVRQSAFSRQRLAWVAAAIVLLLGLAALAVPPVRAAIFEFFQIGTIRIFTGEAPIEEPVLPPTKVPFPLNLAGETTLEAVRTETDMPIKLPTYPAGLGPPDDVFLQEIGVPVVIMAWRDPAVPQDVAMSLFIIDNTALPLGTKFEVERSVATSVNGRPAAWVSGGHILQFEDVTGRIDMELTRLVGSHTLIWQADGVTYRLEADLTLEEMVKIAESLSEAATNFTNSHEN